MKTLTMEFKKTGQTAFSDPKAMPNFRIKKQPH